jgi:hypothetical protein
VKSPLAFQQEMYCWTRRYEQLREQVLAANNLIATDHRGLTVLIKQGMAAWMRAWCEPFCCAAAAPEAEALLMRPKESWQEEAIRLLVNMALSHLGHGACNS